MECHRKDLNIKLRFFQMPINKERILVQNLILGSTIFNDIVGKLALKKYCSLKRFEYREVMFLSALFVKFKTNTMASSFSPQ